MKRWIPMMNHISVDAWRMVMFHEHNSSNKMRTACAICQDEIEMRWPGCLMAGVGRERLTGFQQRPPPNLCQFGLKNHNYCFGTTEPKLSWDFKSWLMLMSVNVCISHQNRGSFIAKKLSCVVIIMIVTWSMGIFFNDVHLHHHLQWCFAHWSFALFCNK